MRTEGRGRTVDEWKLPAHKPDKHLDHAKREVVAARYYDIPAEAVEQAAGKERDVR